MGKVNTLYVKDSLIHIYQNLSCLDSPSDNAKCQNKKEEISGWTTEFFVFLVNEHFDDENVYWPVNYKFRKPGWLIRSFQPSNNLYILLLWNMTSPEYPVLVFYCTVWHRKLECHELTQIAPGFWVTISFPHWVAENWRKHFNWHFLAQICSTKTCDNLAPTESNRTVTPLFYALALFCCSLCAEEWWRRETHKLLTQARQWLKIIVDTCQPSGLRFSLLLLWHIKNTQPWKPAFYLLI